MVNNPDSAQRTSEQKKITVPSIINSKKRDTKLVATTAYDYTSARIIDEAEIDIVLVGDSVATVIQGEESTLPVTLDEMIYHTKLVTRGITRALVVADMPFLSYQISSEEALRAAGRLMKEGRAAAVKLEGGVAVAETISRITAVDIPVMGHIGLTPQSYHRMGGYRVQGRGTKAGIRSAESLIADARAIDESGAFALVLEGIPSELAAVITDQISIPTIGIGAGRDCDGQILVLHDLVGLTQGKTAKFVKRYAELGSTMKQALLDYREEVQSQTFPSDEHMYHQETPVQLATTISGG